MLGLLSFIYGASIGSFTQVVASRLHVAPIMKARSKCLSCNETLRPLDLIPVVSYFLLKGRCRYCKSVYGISALVIELLFGLVFVSLYYSILKNQPSLLLSASWLVYYTILFIVLGVMALYDRLHSYIPLSFLTAYLILSCAMFVLRLTESHTIIDILSPVLVALPFLSIWLITKGKGVGLGDVILFFGVGAFFGVLQGFAVLMLAVWGGALFGLYYKYALQKKQTNTTAIPFVPFISLAVLIVLFTGITVFSFTTPFM